MKPWEMGYMPSRREAKSPLASRPSPFATLAHSGKRGHEEREIPKYSQRDRKKKKKKKKKKKTPPPPHPTTPQTKKTYKQRKHKKKKKKKKKKKSHQPPPKRFAITPPAFSTVRTLFFSFSAARPLLLSGGSESSKLLLKAFVGKTGIGSSGQIPALVAVLLYGWESCQGNTGDLTWQFGFHFFRFLRRAWVTPDSKRDFAALDGLRGRRFEPEEHARRGDEERLPSPSPAHASGSEPSVSPGSLILLSYFCQVYTPPTVFNQKLPCPQGGLLARAKTPRRERRETAFCPSCLSNEPLLRWGIAYGLLMFPGKDETGAESTDGCEDREASFTNISSERNNASRWPHLIVGKAFASDKGLLKISNKPPLRWPWPASPIVLSHGIEDGPVSDAVAFVAGNDPYGLFALGPFLMTITKLRILPAMRLTDVLRACTLSQSVSSFSTRSTDIFQSLPQAGIFPPETIARPHHARDAAQTSEGGQYPVIRNDRDRSRPLLSCKDFTGTDAFQLMRWRGPSFPLPNPSLSARLGKKAMTSSYVLVCTDAFRALSLAIVWLVSCESILGHGGKFKLMERGPIRRGKPICYSITGPPEMSSRFETRTCRTPELRFVFLKVLTHYELGARDLSTASLERRHYDRSAALRALGFFLPSISMSFDPGTLRIEKVCLWLKLPSAQEDMPIATRDVRTFAFRGNLNGEVKNSCWKMEPVCIDLLSINDWSSGCIFLITWGQRHSKAKFCPGTGIAEQGKHGVYIGPRSLRQSLATRGTETDFVHLSANRAVVFHHTMPLLGSTGWQRWLPAGQVDRRYEMKEQPIFENSLSPVPHEIKANSTPLFLHITLQFCLDSSDILHRPDRLLSSVFNYGRSFLKISCSQFWNPSFRSFLSRPIGILSEAKKG
ncbi:hypothetical protein CCUS01_16848 [Colletotrichum cuscutae]|uniref:Uncharacterized protein n=1 Tax=Colletotrichum cuscutae TaxID=1209917 RepID=A0AAI9V870_9PEZI|nr:hypothetical protein CCUS01_16848 [Colletotrichum cuscutae]